MRVLALLAVIGCASALSLSAMNMAAVARNGWAISGPANMDASVTLRFALPHRNMEFLDAAINRLSNPASPDFANYPSMTEVRAMTAPSPAHFEAVRNWLVATNMHFVEETHSVVVTTTVAEAAKLLRTTFHTFTHTSGRTATAGVSVDVPEELAGHVDAVFGVTDLPMPRRESKVGAADVAQVTPDVINTAYGVSGVTAAGSMKNRQAIVEFQGQLLSQTDLTTFFNKYVQGAKSGDDKVYKYVGDQQQGEGVEANLDVQYIMGVAPGVLTEAWQYAGQQFCADLKQWTQQVISTDSPPNVFSVSYGWQGDLSQIGCSTAQVDSIDKDFATITATGVSIIFASGDSGSGSNIFNQLYSSWPASSKYVTAVGATTFQGQSASGPEMATTQFGSGSGFSRVITPAPEWQSAAIASYYAAEPADKLPPKANYGFGGRATPDVAALGEGFQVIINGNAETVGGTSAAAPTFAGIVSLLNEARNQAGKKPLGLLNQFIYQNAEAFTDITMGSDRVSRSGLPVKYGFDCVEGYDPVTGFGTPNFAKLLEKTKNL